MRRHRFPILAIGTLVLLASAAAAVAEVHVTIGFEPADLSGEVAAAPALAGPDAFGRVPAGDADRGMIAGPVEIWYIPYFQADLSQPVDATLWAVRNESELPVEIEVRYFPTDGSSVPDLFELFTIPVHGVRTRNTRDVVGLPADPDGFARGHIRIGASGAISVDYFQLIASQDFATAERGGVLDDVCEELSFRFIDFGGDRGSVATFLVGMPRGTEPGDPPTLVGNVYDEAGAFVNSFALRTDQFSIVLDIRSFVLPGTSFGSIEVNAGTANGTIATITHSAGGRFSVSNPVFCRDFEPVLL